MASLVHKVRSTGSPTYLQALVSDYRPARQLRSSKQLFFAVLERDFHHPVYASVSFTRLRLSYGAHVLATNYVSRLKLTERRVEALYKIGISFQLSCHKFLTTLNETVSANRHLSDLEADWSSVDCRC